MMHLVAYYSSVDPAAAYTALNAVQDPAINTRGTDVRVASQIPFIFGAAGLTAAAVYTSSQLRSPSLRTLNNMFIRPLNNAVTFANPAPVMTFPANPRGMVTAEDVQFWVDSTPGAGAEAHYGLVWMCDGPLAPVNGEIFSVGATAASTLTAGNWVNIPQSRLTRPYHQDNIKRLVCVLKALTLSHPAWCSQVAVITHSVQAALVQRVHLCLKLIIFVRANSVFMGRSVRTTRQHWIV